SAYKTLSSVKAVCKSVTITVMTGHVRRNTQQSQLSYPFIKREIKRLRELLLRFADSKEMQQALKDAGLPDNAWLRLQQQRHHIVKQCKKAALW
ncbi:hypothetical protein ACQKD0_12420, partial [Vreelandella aquamarina]|uniref:hypothetical protein n=1 Tax=Vreelandella aquamarina TaxID=77097 RepID=UPI003D074555